MLDKLNYDDIVTIEDYPGEYWRITGFQTNILRSKGEPEITEEWIDVTCPWTGEYNMAYLDEITLVALADEAEDFLADKPEPVRTHYEGLSIATIFGLDDESPRKLKPLTPKSDKPAQQARIDALLDERNAVADIDFVEDASRAARYAEIDAEIAKEVDDGTVCETHPK